MTERAQQNAQPVAGSDDKARLVASYEAKVADLQRETLKVDAALSVCRRKGEMVGMEGVGWDAALEAVERAINEATATHQKTA